MKKRMLFIVVTMLFIIVSSIFIFIETKPKVINNWSDETMIILSNQTWDIQFSKRIKPETVNAETIYVTDEKGEKQDITLSISKDLRTVTVHPPEQGYSSIGDSYILTINNSIEAVLGRSLAADKKVSFVVKENLPVVGSKEKLNEIFFSAIKREKKNQKRMFFAEESVEEKSSIANDTAASGEVQTQNYSETNGQVQGVDEADTVKTDGSYIYQVVDGKILITKATPVTEMKLEGTIQYNSKFSPEQLFLYGDQLVVIGHSYDEKMQPKMDGTKESLIIPYYFHSSKAVVYDISKKSEPKQIREVEVEGSLVSSRRIGKHIYLIAYHYPDIWMLEDESNLDLRPRYYDSTKSNESQFVDYEKIQYVPESQETNYSIIASFNLDEKDKEVSLTTYLGSGHQIYMSKENLYLAVTNYQTMIDSKEDVYNAPDTNVYKFSIEGDKVTFDHSTEIPGTILNQFSMDEYQGYFRVATTKGDTWNDEKPSANNLYILDENLKKVGELENLARGERIYSARFMGNRIYIVTFKQVDPLFVIDASNPTAPKVVGELKIPGYSNYLHPFDENHLIGFGHDTRLEPNKEGGEPFVLMEGVKVSLFDVSDVANPKEKYTEIIGGRGTYTPLDYDHKALLMNRDKGIFAFPISIYHEVEGNDYEQRFEFQGAYVFHLSIENGFTLQQKISHLEETGHYEEWEAGITRLVYIGDYLYSLSPSKITAHHMKNFKLEGEVTY